MFIEIADNKYPPDLVQKRAISTSWEGNYEGRFGQVGS